VVWKIKRNRSEVLRRNVVRRKIEASAKAGFCRWVKIRLKDAQSPCGGLGWGKGEQQPYQNAVAEPRLAPHQHGLPPLL